MFLGLCYIDRFIVETYSNEDAKETMKQLGLWLNSSLGFVHAGGVVSSVYEILILLVTVRNI